MTVLVIGELTRTEFRPLRESLALLGSDVRYADLASAQTLLADGDGPQPDLIVLGQAYPGQYPEQVLAQFRCVRPLASIVLVTGAWCAGEARTGQPPVGTPRIAWHDWIVRFASERRRNRLGQPSYWAAPATIDEAERWLAEAPPIGIEPKPAELARTVVIGTDSRALWETLRDALDHPGRRVEWQRSPAPSVRPLGAAIWDLPAGVEDPEYIVAQLQVWNADRACVIAGFPRPELWEALHRTGVTLVSKPLLIRELRAWLAE